MFTLLLYTLEQQWQHSLRKQESAFDLNLPSGFEVFVGQLQERLSDKTTARVKDCGCNGTAGEQFRGNLFEGIGYSRGV